MDARALLFVYVSRLLRFHDVELSHVLMQYATGSILDFLRVLCDGLLSSSSWGAQRPDAYVQQPGKLANWMSRTLPLHAHCHTGYGGLWYRDAVA